MNKKALQVLLVEDNATDAILVREMFRKEQPGSFELTHLSRMSEALARLAQGGIDIVLLDMGLPDGHGLETVKRTQAAAPGTPVIVLTGLDDEALAADALKEGAHDYLIKGQIENRALPRALRHAIERHRMQTETDLIRTQQIQFKDEFLSHVSHELRSPLTAIYQFVTILGDRLAGDLNVEQQEYLEIILRNVKQLQSMINDLLEVTREQAGKLMIETQCTPASDAIAYAVNTLQGAAIAKGIALSRECQDSLPSVCADPMRLRQILIILLDNAIKFTPANGAVRIHARVDEGFPGLLLLEVRDSGCGIPSGMTERIFERLVQASDPALAGRNGLGLGLYICKELVTRQGGKIWATSAPGRGSVFSVTLPVFSLPRLIAPSLKKGRRQQDHLTLVVTEIGSATGWLSEEVRGNQRHRIQHILKHCLHSDLDVLLPKMGFAGAAELFFILAFTDRIGGEAIVKRIQAQLEGCDEIRHEGLTFSICYLSLKETGRRADESMEEFSGRVAAQVRGLMDQEFSSRMVVHG
jgi:signal transduction histidine kinase